MDSSKSERNADKYDREKGQNRKNQVGTGDRSERIRTYNFPQSRITDHRVNYTSHALHETMMGELDHLIDFLEKEDLTQRIKNIDLNKND